ncbi:MAG: 50S ribosomal protein L19e [Candidatus Woesearchaeota archaeon]|jgi:large subunit ribosomal protein L19e|nr:50S ribosomal protein L19e [Candidatus Woesearchaeota archaeon]|tara:strand:- start:7629 stop:8084 length:456 start_codon:yes stop_codon:yes gene_type:complete
MLDVQRRLAAQILKCGKHRIRFDTDRLTDIKEAITKTDIRSLINNGVISKRRDLSTSRFWARKRKHQKSRGRQKGFGSRKGRKTARLNPKRVWINKVRLQRDFIKSMRDKGTLGSSDYHELYLKSKGGFFRSIRHLKLYVRERGLIKNDQR